MAGEAQIPGRVMSEEEYTHIRHRHWVAAGLVDGKTVLDIGCGAGLGLNLMTEKASRVVCTDLFAANIALVLNQRLDNVEALVMDAHHLEFPDNSFDVILAMEVAQYLRMEEFLSEVRRLLVVGGTLFICQPNPDRPDFFPGRGTIRYYSVGELDYLLRNSGFKPRIMGAFSVPSKTRKATIGIRDGIIRTGIMFLDFMAPVLPVRRIKDFVRDLIRYKPVKLKAVLDETDMNTVMNIELADLSSMSHDIRHIFLYAFARRMK